MTTEAPVAPSSFDEEHEVAYWRIRKGKVRGTVILGDAGVDLDDDGNIVGVEILGRLVRRCPCGALFFVTDRRQRYCPPAPGESESRCGRRLRSRTQRRKQRERRR